MVLEDVKRAREASFDFYSAVRSAYLQHRESLLHDRAGTTRESDDTLYYPDEAKP
jgi:ABC-type transporter lipoprotein component MlaA